MYIYIYIHIYMCTKSHHILSLDTSLVTAVGKQLRRIGGTRL